MSISYKQKNSDPKRGTIKKSIMGAITPWFVLGSLALTVFGGLGMAVPAQAASVSEDQVREAVTNTGNQLLKSWWVDKDIKEGDSLDSLYTKAPDAFVVPAGIQMAIVYAPASPGQFALCGWGTNGKIGNGKSAALAYKSPTGAYSPMAINCNPDGANAIDLKLKQGDLIKTDRPEGIIFPTVEGAPIAAVEAPIAVAPVPAAPAPAPAPAEPIVIPWGGIIVGALILVAIGILIFLSTVVYKLSRKVKSDSQKTSMNVAQWKELVARFDTITTEWASYELDPVKILDFPLLSDMRESNTINFHNSLRKAKHLKPADVRKMTELDAVSSPFAKAVEDLENAFHTAETEAKRVRWSNFTPDERKRLQTAKNLLNLAMDGGATDSERQAAYKRMQKELDGLIVVPKATLLALEKKVSLMLTDGSEDENTPVISLSK